MTTAHVAQAATTLSDLPVELIITIVRHASDNCNELCRFALTSRLIWRVVQPILYETVIITAHNLDIILDMGSDPKFRATRHLLIDALEAKHSRFRVHTAQIARAFSYVRHLAASETQLCSMMRMNDRFRPSRFTCIGYFNQDLWARKINDAPDLTGITHIHVNIGPAWLDVPPPPPSHPLPFSHVVVLLPPYLSHKVLPWFLESPALQRIEIWDLMDETSQFDWEEHLTVLSRERKPAETRIWLLSRAECSRICQLPINRRGLGSLRPMITFEPRLWDDGKQIARSSCRLPRYRRIFVALTCQRSQHIEHRFRRG